MNIFLKKKLLSQQMIEVPLTNLNKKKAKEIALKISDKNNQKLTFLEHLAVQTTRNYLLSENLRPHLCNIIFRGRQAINANLLLYQNHSLICLPVIPHQTSILIPEIDCRSSIIAIQFSEKLDNAYILGWIMSSLSKQIIHLSELAPIDSLLDKINF